MNLDPDRVYRLAQEAHARRGEQDASATRTRLEAEIAKLKRR
jgi:hypothetical protein